jgi:hypothetical protein
MSTLEATILSLALLEGLDPNTAQQTLIDLWANVESSRSDLPAEGYKKGDVISVQIGVRDLNTASGQAPGWSRYLIVVCVPVVRRTTSFADRSWTGCSSWRTDGSVLM